MSLEKGASFDQSDQFLIFYLFLTNFFHIQTILEKIQNHSVQYITEISSWRNNYGLVFVQH